MPKMKEQVSASGNNITELTENTPPVCSVETKINLSEFKNSRETFQHHPVLKTDAFSQNIFSRSDKVNSSSLNVFALLSILLIPVFFVSLFIHTATGGMIVFICLIAGPLLAILSATVVKKKLRNWMTGVALGFWALFVLYALLLLFVF